MHDQLRAIEDNAATVAHCPQCGATLRTGETCEDHYYAGQVRELTDPAYGAVHHLSVPCFMLQHNRYSQEGWIRVREVLAQFVAGLAPEEARQRGRRTLDSGHRTYSFTRGPKLAGVDAVAWSRTVTDVRLDTSAHYCSDVREWAASIVCDSEELMQTVTGTR